MLSAKIFIVLLFLKALEYVMLHSSLIHQFYQQLSEGWENTVCATVLKDKLYAITRNGKLWEIDPSTGTYTELKSEYFEGATAMTRYKWKLPVESD